MRRKKLRITEADYLKANRKASRQEEIESHGHPVHGRAMIHKSKKVYDRNRIKRAAIKSDDSSHFFIPPPFIMGYTCTIVSQILQLWVNSQPFGDYLIIKVLIDSDLTISKGLCSTGSSDVV